MDHLTKTLLAHRYLYYVEGVTLISDYDYDMMETRWEKQNGRSFVEEFGVGSSNLDSYPEQVIKYARTLEYLFTIKYNWHPRLVRDEYAIMLSKKLFPIDVHEDLQL